MNRSQYKVRKRWNSLIVVCWTILIATGSFADDSIRIHLAAPRIAHLVEQDGSGIYQKILARALTDPALTSLPLSLKQSFFPYKRALSTFLDGETECVYSFTKVAQKALGERKVVYSFPLGAFAYHIFTRKKDPVISGPDGLVGHRVGGVIGHDSYYRHRLGALPLQLVTSDEQNIELIRLGRIDALIAAIPDILPYAGTLHFDPDAPLVKSYDRITCHDRPVARRFLSALNPVLRRLHSDGVYREIAGPLYVPFDAPE